MIKINDNYLKLPGSYLFFTIAKKVSAYQAEHPEAEIIRMGIGDVTLPLAPQILKALHEAVDEMGDKETFKGYAPDLGYRFLRETIAREDYQARGCKVDADEIFISDGAKCDCGNIQELFAADAKIAVCDPVYPVYVDSNVMAGRTGVYDPVTETWSDVIYLPCTMDNDFFPELPKETPDLIYLCNPCNPTGTTWTKEQLKVWVDYANAHDAVILYDAAYEAYITTPEVPHSIYEVEGARTCAIEFRSFSKTAGFTGVRCAYTVVPKELERGGVRLRDLWNRRQGSKFNGVSYVVQRAAEAVFTPEGQAQTQKAVAYYLNNAQVIKKGLSDAGLTVYGGENAPYIWAQTPAGMGSWDFFDLLLKKACVVTTPGAGFGPSGEGYVRLTAFGDADATRTAVERIAGIL